MTTEADKEQILIFVSQPDKSLSLFSFMMSKIFFVSPTVHTSITNLKKNCKPFYAVFS